VRAKLPQGVDHELTHAFARDAELGGHRVGGPGDAVRVGDMAHLDSYRGGGAYPMVAQVAMHQGRLAAENIAALEQRRELSPFH